MKGDIIVVNLTSKNNLFVRDLKRKHFNLIPEINGYIGERYNLFVKLFLLKY